MGEGTMRHCLPSPAPSPAVASLPDDDDLLREFLLRLPPRPFSIPRASLVCKRWHRLLLDPHFLRRFRDFHHREPALLGFFVDDFGRPCFHPTLDPPDRIPSARLGCRHGLALLLSQARLELNVWDPVSGDQRRVAFPPALFRNEEPKQVRNGALLCNDDHAGQVPLGAFKVVLLRTRTDDWLHAGNHHVFASLYDSETGVWGNLISTSIKAPLSILDPSILVVNSLCWRLVGYEKPGILVFDLDRQSLGVINYPEGITDRLLMLQDLENGG